MKYLFIIQGEGRGHLTQAITLFEMLQNNGDEVVATLMGVATEKPIPTFFSEKIHAPIIPFESPSLVYHPTKNYLSFKGTFKRAFLHLPNYLKSIRKINKLVKVFEPDVIVNFYDVLGGIHQFYSQIFNRSAKPMICLAHQYLFLHKDFVFPPSTKFIDKYLVNLYSKVTALRATQKLALSFTAFQDDVEGKIAVVPPLVRSEVWELKKQETEQKGFILAYMTIPAMEKELIAWCKKNPTIEVHCFSSRVQASEIFRYSRNLYFHRINGERFLKMMSECEALACTSGFESICEAALLQKPIMVVPIKNHFEQLCNAFDGKSAGISMISDKFDLTILTKNISKFRSPQQLETWFENAESIILSHLSVNQEVTIPSSKSVNRSIPELSYTFSISN